MTTAERQSILNRVGIGFLVLAAIQAVALAVYLFGNQPEIQPAYPALPSTTTSSITATTRPPLQQAPVPVPDVRGLSTERAVEILVANGFDEKAIATDEATHVAEPGTVVSQSVPPGGTAEGSMVLTVATPATVPDLAGLSEAAAALEVEAFGTTLVTEFLYVPGAQPGLVVGQDPPPGDALRGPVTATVGIEPISVPLTSLDRVDQSECRNRDQSISGDPYPMSVRCIASVRNPDRFAEYNLGRDFEALSMVLGIDDRSADTVRVRFRIIVDGNVLEEVEVSFGEAVPVHLDVIGGLRLRLEAKAVEAENERTNVDAVFGDPVLLGDPAYLGEDQ